MELFGYTFFEKSEKRHDFLTGNFNAYTGIDGVGKIKVTETSALKLSAVWACVRTISNSLATLPSNFHERFEDGNSKIATDIAGQLVMKSPNPFMNPYNFKVAMIMAKLLHGNGYSYINRDSNGWPISLIPIHPSRIEVKAEGGNVTYTLDSKSVDSNDLLHFKGPSLDGLIGLSTIRYQAENIGLALSAQNESKNFFEKGSKIDGFISYMNQLGAGVKDKTIAAFEKNHSGSDAKKVAVFDNGAKYVPVGINPKDAMWLESMGYGVRDIARIFGVPPHLIQDLDNATNNNIEHQGMDFVNHCLLPHAKEFEEELERKLLLTVEKPNHYFKFNMNGLLRGDSQARAAFYNSLIQNAIMTPNQAAQLEELPTYIGGDIHVMQLNMMDVTKLTDYYLTKNDTSQRDLTTDELLDLLNQNKK